MEEMTGHKEKTTIELQKQGEVSIFEDFNCFASITHELRLRCLFCAGGGGGGGWPGRDGGTQWTPSTSKFLDGIHLKKKIKEYIYIYIKLDLSG